jgi:hypothetical protein
MFRKETDMWIKAGTRFFNTDTIAYIQVAFSEDGKDLKAAYLHFVNESHTFTLHGEEATRIFTTLEEVALKGEPHLKAAVKS